MRRRAKQDMTTATAHGRRQSNAVKCARCRYFANGWCSVKARRVSANEAACAYGKRLIYVTERETKRTNKNK